MATHSFNTLIKIGDGTGGASTGYPTDTSDPSTGDPSQYTTIAEVKDFDGPSTSVGEEETTFHDSGTPKNQFIPGLIDDGEVTLTINYDPTDSTHNNTAGLLSDLYARTKDRDFVIVPASDPGDGSHSIYFEAFVTNFNPTWPVSGLMEADVTLRLTGGTIVRP